MLRSKNSKKSNIFALVVQVKNRDRKQQMYLKDETLKYFTELSGKHPMLAMLLDFGVSAEEPLAMKYWPAVGVCWRTHVGTCSWKSSPQQIPARPFPILT